jgi:hypothetical protein
MGVSKHGMMESVDAFKAWGCGGSNAQPFSKSKRLVGQKSVYGTPRAYLHRIHPNISTRVGADVTMISVAHRKSSG